MIRELTIMIQLISGQGGTVGGYTFFNKFLDHNDISTMIRELKDHDPIDEISGQGGQWEGIFFLINSLTTMIINDDKGIEGSWSN